MDMKFDKIFRPLLRHVEHSDARMEIRRKEEDEYNRRREKNADIAESDMWEDHTTLSLGALKALLIRLLQTGDTRQNERLPKSGSPSAQTTLPLDEKAAQAAKSYSKMQHYVQPEDASIEPPPGEISGMPPLSLDEREVARGLIRDIDTLIARDVHEIDIPRRGNLLSSIQEAVAFRLKT